MKDTNIRQEFVIIETVPRQNIYLLEKLSNDKFDQFQSDARKEHTETAQQHIVLIVEQENRLEMAGLAVVSFCFCGSFTNGSTSPG